MTRLVLFVCISVSAGCGRVVLVESSGGGGAASSAAASTAIASSTSTTGGAGGAPTCPDSPPVGGPCVHEGLSCAAPNACCGGNAVCTDGIWTFPVTKSCEGMCNKCGYGQSSAFTCTTESICVTIEDDSSIFFQCEKDLCPGETDCECDSKLCEGFNCVAHDSVSLECDCSNC